MDKKKNADLKESVLVYLVHTSNTTEEEIPFLIRDLVLLPHDVNTQHEGEDQLVDFKQTSGTIK